MPENTNAAAKEPEINFLGFSGKNTVGEIRAALTKKHLDFIVKKFNEIQYNEGKIPSGYFLYMLLTKEQLENINLFFCKEESIRNNQLSLEKGGKNIKTEIITAGTSLENLFKILFDDINGYGKRATGQFLVSANKDQWIKDIKYSYFKAAGAAAVPRPVSDPRSSKKELGFIGEKLDKIISSRRKQIVLTGAPGTGKTYGVRKYAAKMLGKNIDELDNDTQFEFVQFHSSYNYVDFVEGLKPAMINGQRTFVRMDGVFKAFCRRAAADGNPDNIYYFVIDEINRADLSGVFGELMFCLEESYRGKKGRVVTQYHNLPTYEYIPFVEREETDYTAVINSIIDSSDKTANEKKDMLNELFSNKGSDDVQPVLDDIFADGFFIPENVIVIGTMNDIDRNVETFDFALRRRFRWIDIDADESLNILDIILKDYVNLGRLKKRAAALNRVISDERYRLGREFKLGLSYFAKAAADNDSVNYFDAELRPILEEYVRGKKGRTDFISECRNAFVNISGS